MSQKMLVDSALYNVTSTSTMHAIQQCLERAHNFGLWQCKDEVLLISNWLILSATGRHATLANIVSTVLARTGEHDARWLSSG